MSSSKGSSSKTSRPESPRSGRKGRTRHGQMRQCLSIIVFRGDPIDSYQYRHAGLSIQYQDQDGTVTGTNFLDVAGSAGIFERQENTDQNPANDQQFESEVHVATIPATGSSDSRLRDTIWWTPINNASYEWNCQSYVTNALHRCLKAGLILDTDVDSALDGMTDILLEAPDEVV